MQKNKKLYSYSGTTDDGVDYVRYDDEPEYAGMTEQEIEAERHWGNG